MPEMISSTMTGIYLLYRLLHSKTGLFISILNIYKQTHLISRLVVVFLKEVVTIGVCRTIL